jgi:hypothetical protein
VWLTLGDLRRGLPEYEWRLDPGARETPRLQAWPDAHRAPAPASSRAAMPPAAQLPRWNGEPLAGRTLLIRAEQGFGDTLQFVRFMPLVAAQQPRSRIVLEVQPSLLPLIAPAMHASRVTVIAQGTPLPAADVQCPLLSVPLALGTSTLDTLPDRTPYLAAPPEYRRRWRGSLGGQARRKIGLAWSGRIQQHENRSLPPDALHALDPLFALDGIDWIVLQPQLSAAEHAALDAHPRASSIHRLGARIADFADTAAIIERLEAVVSIDTSIAHLAGALGVPLWAMLPFAADWRWFTGTDRSPWYPKARLVRQPRPGAWQEVIETVAQALRDA